MNFILKQSKEVLVTPTGLALVGKLLSKTSLKTRLNRSSIHGVPHPYITHGEIAYSYLGLLCQGKKEYEAVEEFRNSDFFRYALRLKHIPSCVILRQRFDMAGNRWNAIIGEESLNLIHNANAVITPCTRDLIAMDIDVSPFDNSNTKKEGISRAYNGVIGYAPILTYLGQEGYCIHVQLREGKTHSQKETASYLAQSIYNAKKVTNHPLLVRMDAGNDSIDNIKVCQHKDTQADFIIKRNLRKERLEDWLHIAQNYGICCEERPGKKVYMGDFPAAPDGLEKPVRIAYKVIERTTKANGQILLIPEIEVESYWTSLLDPPYRIIELYHDHGTSEQFHSEIKTDLDLERFPSGKFETNELILQLGVMAYNILRIIGQESIKKQNPCPGKEVFRRRIRTVIQNFITIASRVVYHRRQHMLNFGCQCPWFSVFKRIYEAFG